MADEKPSASSHAADLIANLERQGLKVKQEVNKIQSIPKASDGRTENLGNAPTPPPLEPTVNEPGYVVYQNPPDPAASVPAPAPRAPEVVKPKA